MTVSARLIVGQVMKFVNHARGGYYLIWSEAGRYRIYPSQVPGPLAVGEVITFLPDPESSGNCRRVREVLFREPDNSNSSTPQENNTNERKQQTSN